uniref:Uncharacterized protein n=1 Tax=Arundo donax TaxID=35708 RepID=A0A0A8Y742_ARUDO
MHLALKRLCAWSNPFNLGIRTGPWRCSVYREANYHCSSSS